MFPGPVGFLDTFGFLASAFAECFGVCMLIADAIAVAYVFTEGILQRRTYWVTFGVVIIVNLLMLAVGTGLWWEAVTRIPNVSSASLSKYNVVSLPAMLAFFVAPWVRRWHLRRNDERRTD